jgi:alpha-1,2-mannosyltransferase
MATRRYATAVTVAVAGAVGALGGWAVIGFAGLRDYPELLNRLAALVQEEGYSPIALGLALGLPIDLARAAAFALGAGLLVAMFVLARRPDGDRRSFVVAIVAAFVFSPIVWLHYLTLLVVPVAMVAKRLSILWFVPIAYLTSGVNSEGNASTIAVVWLITAALVLATLRPRVSALGSSTARSAVAA